MTKYKVEVDFSGMCNLLEVFFSDYHLFLFLTNSVTEKMMFQLFLLESSLFELC